MIEIKPDFNSVLMKTFVKKPVKVKAIQINTAFTVYTMEGKMNGKEGDFLVKGIKGELYPVDKEIFIQTYQTEDGKKIEIIHNIDRGKK